MELNYFLARVRPFLVAMLPNMGFGMTYYCIQLQLVKTRLLPGVQYPLILMLT